ncbi:MAG: DNA polymerase I [Candidatus Rokubacteria bacterium]|nr:DNA polymerase I [Candidatus Rokubacteria bacterium]
MTERVVLLDGPGYLYRAYHALPFLSTSKGVPAHAVFGMSTMVWKLLREEEPAYVAVAWDPPGPTFREQRFEAYKETRTAMPDDMRPQIPRIMALFDALRIPVLEMRGFEADDVLATLVERFRGADLDIILVTGDKDMLQLVGPRVRVLSTMGYKNERVVYDEAAVKDKWGVAPGQIPDVLALMGDAIDNIPGIPGVGQKTAARLIAQFGSVERLYESLPLVAGKLRETLAAHRKQALLAGELAKVSTLVPLEVGLEDLRRVDPDWERLRALWTELEFHTLLRQLPAPTTAAPVEEVAALEDAAAVATWLGGVPPGAPVAVEWVGDAVPPDPHPTALGLFHPAAGPAALRDGALAAALVRHPVVAYDVKPLLEWATARGLDLPDYEDAAVAVYLLNPARTNYRLEDVAAELLGDGPGTAPPGTRARWVSRLFKHTAAALEETGLREIYETIERPLVAVLARMERHGIRVDPGRLADFAKELERSLDNLTREIHALAGEEFNIGSPKQLASVLFEKLKLPPLRRTKTGYSTDADVLEQLALGHPLPARIVEHRTLSKLKSGYADALPGLVHPGTGRIHTSFNQLVAATGRLSSSQPNLQNIPVRTELGRRIRAAFVPEPGWRFLAADYSQIELRILAHVSGEESLLEAFRRGEDIHRRTASEVFGIEPATVTPAQRDIAKTTNFSVIYGVTAFGLSRGLAITPKEAQEFLTRFFERHPKVKTWLDRTVAEGRARGHVETLLGRRRYLPELRSGNPNLRSFAERMATNAPIQGTAADLIKIAMVRLDRALAAAGGRSRMLLQVHDELLFEVPPDEIEDLTTRVREVMESAMSLAVPLTVDVKTGDDWSEV